MTDSKFTAILGGILVSVKEMHDWGIDTGHVDQAKLRLTVMARQEEAKKLIEAGVSQRKAAKLLGVSPAQVNADVQKLNKSVQKRAARKTKAKGLTGPVRDDDLIQEDCAHCETLQDQWVNSFSQLAGDAIAARAYWARAFEEWEKFEVTSDLVKLAKQASEEWDILATHLSRRFKNGSKAT